MSNSRQFRQLRPFLVKILYRGIYGKVCGKHLKLSKPSKTSARVDKKQPFFTPVGGYLTPTPQTVNKYSYLVDFISFCEKRKKPVPDFVGQIRLTYGR